MPLQIVQIATGGRARVDVVRKLEETIRARGGLRGGTANSDLNVVPVEVPIYLIHEVIRLLEGDKKGPPT